MNTRAAFLDRDGVLIRDSGYPHLPEHLIWIDGAREAVRRLNAAGWRVVVVTNQSGVARGMFDEAAVETFHALMNAELARVGAHIDAFYYCPYLDDAPVARYRVPDHPDRKPNPGMLLRAIADLGLDPGASFMVGDRDSDLEAAARAGVRGVKFEGGNLLEALNAVRPPVF